MVRVFIIFVVKPPENDGLNLLTLVREHKRVICSDALHEAAADGSPRGVSFRAGIHPDERYAVGLVVEHLFALEPMVAEILSVIRAEENHGILILAGGTQNLENTTDC